MDISADVLVEAAADMELAVETTMVEEATAEALEPHPLMELTNLIPIAHFPIMNGNVLAEKGVTMSSTIANSQEEADVDIAEDAVTKDVAEADVQLEPSNLTTGPMDKAMNKPARTLVRLEMIVEALMDADLDAVPMEVRTGNGDYLGRQRCACWQ